MTEHSMTNQDPSGPAQYIGSLSALSAKSFPSTEALIEAILALITDQLGLRTSFLTQITPADNRSHVVAAYNQPDGCDLPAGVDLPLEDTF